ncbi:uncharacterized protein [Amphiura filiformis]|uniref:uncharacterized protein n=1 Tax=Amphiura filiformis TaxID=82378 RepID=UPI003B210777
MTGILYSCLARDTIILVEHSMTFDHNFQGVARSMLQNISSQSDSKTMYTADQYNFHVIVDNGITYISATTADFSKQNAHLFLKEIIGRIAASSLSQRVQHAGEYELNRDFSSVLSQEMDHFSNLRGGNNKLDNLQNQVDEVKDIMCQNIDRVLSRGEKLDVLLEKTEDLEASAQTFQKTARKTTKKYWWKNTRWTILLVIVVLIVLLAIILIILKVTNVI